MENKEINDEDKESFKLIIENLPPAQKAAWDHLVSQIEKDGEENVHKHLLEEFENNPDEKMDTAGSCGVDW